MLKINDLHVHYGGIHAVKGVSLSIPRGSVVTLIGANGAGKSSIIRSIAGLVKGAKGEVLFTRNEGDKPMQLLGQPAENMVRSGIALSPEGRRILPHLTVAENLQLGAWCREDKDGIAKDIETNDTVFMQTTARLPWLLIGMLGGIGSSMLLNNFTTTLGSHPEMALFIPLLAGMGGNVGVQSSAIAVQGLANNSLDSSHMFKHIMKELLVAIINATILSLIV